EVAQKIDLRPVGRAGELCGGDQVLGSGLSQRLQGIARGAATLEQFQPGCEFTAQLREDENAAVLFDQPAGSVERGPDLGPVVTGFVRFAGDDDEVDAFAERDPPVVIEPPFALLEDGILCAGDDLGNLPAHAGDHLHGKLYTQQPADLVDGLPD